ncbi:MAG TPA: WhiB family transcriptional regulator [Chloroflexota bacterium]|nr:WhiB family transcriptional regulator [Chloroflexota bacterium]
MTCIEQVPFPGPWRQRGACVVVPTEVFFPGRGRSVEPAKAVCRACPVMAECREYALGISDLKGIWGGLAEEERQRLQRQRDGAVAPAPPPPAPPASRPRRQRRGPLYRALVELSASPGRWARVAWYPGIHTAGGMAARLRAGMVAAPKGPWQFEARADDGGSGLWARYVPARGDEGSTEIAS